MSTRGDKPIQSLSHTQAVDERKGLFEKREEIVSLVDKKGLLDNDCRSNFSLRVDISTDRDVSSVSINDDMRHISMEINKEPDGSKLYNQRVGILTDDTCPLTHDHLQKISVVVTDNKNHISSDYCEKLTINKEPMGTPLNYSSMENTLTQNIHITSSVQSSIKTPATNIPVRSFTNPENINCEISTEQAKQSKWLIEKKNLVFGNEKGMKISSEHPDYKSIFSNTKKIKHIGEGVFACELIPKWIELQFGLESNISIANTVYNLVCSEREQDVGAYLLTQVKQFAMPELVSDLLLHVEEPDQFLVHLASNLSLICKYHNGKLKGNTLTIEIMNCRDHYWAFVDVNIKYPQNLCATDITISEQRIGKLELSQVRKIFDSSEKGPDQLFNFAEALTKLQY
ncbi:uncharacterized protein LOC124352767 [Homalodisca vitripennis]|uniref:uncharacterized protein LOC124352767 n=1 Tax=Homalodisca vitripennis TaxID=197043 RepID=UPI001EEACA2B|nr:uncharacterized protein LOC124352767 [Homalodisca vitripennis]